MNENWSGTDKARPAVLRSLAATREAGPGACPGDEELAGLIDGHLRGPARDRLLAHLDQCTDCRQVWLEVSAEAPVAAGRAPHRLADIRAGLHALCRPALAVPVAAALVLAIGLGVWQGAAPADRIGQRLHALSEVGEARVPPAPWQGAALGFASVEPTALQQAYAAGYQQARVRLADGIAPARSETAAGPLAAVRDFGRWSLLLEVELTVGLDPESHRWHQETARDLARRIERLQPGSDAAGLDEARARLAALEAALAEPGDPGETGWRNRVRRRLTLAVQTLAPVRP